MVCCCVLWTSTVSGVSCEQRSNRLKMTSIGFSCLLFFMNWCPANCHTYIEFLAKTLPDLCPYSTFCTMSPSKQFKHSDSSPCCKPCSCDADCLINGNCCPDHPSLREDSAIVMPTATCSPPIHYGYDGFEVDMDIYHHLSLGFHRHYIISTCPLGYNDQEIINKCINANIQNTWDTGVMVSDGRGRAFYNQYCAKCNGVQSFTRWDLKLFCWKYTNKMMNVQNLQTLNENQCILMSSPPTENIDLASRCYLLHYDKCNMTGQWKNFNPSIQRACESSTFPFVNEHFVQMVAYKNVYCYLCNTHHEDVAIYTVCEPDSIDERLRQLERVYFSALLETVPGVSIEMTNCPSSHIYDHHFEKCRLLHCPFYLFPQNGKCVNLFKETFGMTIFAQVNVSYGNEDTRRVYSLFNKDPYNSIGPFESIANHLYISLDIEKYGCVKCKSTAYVRYDNPGVLFKIGFATNKRCPAATIIAMINKWRLRVPRLYVNMDTQQLVFVPALTYDWNSQTLVDDFVESITVLRHEFMADESANRLWPMFYCAHVDLSPREYTQMMSSYGHTVRASDFIAIGNEMDPGNTTGSTTESYRICIDNYLPHNNGNTGVDTYLMERILAATLIGILVVS